MTSPPPTALVTGASSGIGLELARVFAAHGHDLILVARNGERLARLRDELGGRPRTLPSDLSAPGAADRIFRELQGTRVDVLVNNAGLGTYGPFASTPPEKTLELLQVNLVALTQLTRLFLPAMIERQTGGVLNVASTAAFQPGPRMATYYASKAYVLHFSEALAEEVRGTGVTVSVLCPGPTHTEFHARADMEHVRLMHHPFVMDAATVARKGYQGFRRGRRVIVPGVMNELLRQAVRVSPRRLVARVAGMVNS